MKPRTVSIPQRGVNFDMVMWLFTRLSALAMYAVALVAVIAALIMGARQQMSLPDLLRWALTPISSHVLNTNVPNIDLWKGLFWQVMGILMLVLAGAHGLHGLLTVIEDYLTVGWIRRTLRLLILAIWVAMSVIGSYVILTT
jgi:succinate dehydrogenase hydrophobic anchor subunit